MFCCVPLHQHPKATSNRWKPYAACVDTIKKYSASLPQREIEKLIRSDWNWELFGEISSEVRSWQTAEILCTKHDTLAKWTEKRLVCKDEVSRWQCNLSHITPMHLCSTCKHSQMKSSSANPFPWILANTSWAMINTSRKRMSPDRFCTGHHQSLLTQPHHQPRKGQDEGEHEEVWSYRSLQDQYQQRLPFQLGEIVGWNFVPPQINHQTQLAKKEFFHRRIVLVMSWNYKTPTATLSCSQIPSHEFRHLSSF